MDSKGKKLEKWLPHTIRKVLGELMKVVQRGKVSLSKRRR